MKKRIFITSNKNPDLDGYACAVGYAEFLNRTGKKAKAILLGEIEDETKFVLNLADIKSMEKYGGEIDSDLIIVDTTNLQSLGRDVDKKLLVEMIDHRRVNDASLYPWAKVQNELVGSCATLITEKFMQAKIKPSKETAYLLYGAIVSNTINFKNKITSDRDRAAASFLKKLIDIPEDFAEKMFRARTNISGGNLSNYLHKDFIEQNVCGKIMTIFQMEIVETDNLIKNRLDEIKDIIHDIIKDKKLDYYFLNIIDTLKAYNYILVVDEKTETLLKKILELNFVDKLVKTDHIIMRKEIIAKIKDHFSYE